MKIKICGLTHIKEAEYLNINQVDLAGMVLFFPKSKRNITIDKAKEIMHHLNNSIKTVAVVVSPTIEQIREIENAGFDYIQIHGELSENLLKKINLPVLKAFNVTDIQKLSCYEKENKIKGYVFDAESPGSGKVFNWNILKDIPIGEKLFILAGGLDPDNVREAVSQVKPDCIDVSSGVEFDEKSEKTGKDPRKIASFVRNARTEIQFFDNLNNHIKNIRVKVFVEEQGFVNEFDHIDNNARHLLCWCNGEPVGTCRIYFNEKNNTYSVGRIAVIKNYRGLSLGKEILKAAEKEVARLGGKEVTLSAQERASVFYEKQGYTKYGDVYLDEYCPHIAMKKTI